MKTNVVLLAVSMFLLWLLWASRQTAKIHTEIHVNASPSDVWAVLVDTVAYPEWNPTIVEMNGPLREGQRIRFVNQSENGKRMTFHPRIMSAEVNKELRWLGQLPVPRLFDGEHYFVLIETEHGGTKLIHGERFQGVLIPFVRDWLENDILSGFERMNAALAQRVIEKR